ncbi:MAG: family 78 glycoside hydrolase catalytic domain [Melioribacteraceae bacterium]|nr:family 78 glycoside hydrolase catalytic domain [Melioribacteraceae bacterium]
MNIKLRAPLINMKGKYKFYILLICCLMLTTGLLSQAKTIEPINLNIASIEIPSGIDDLTPTFRWSIRSEGKNIFQSSFAIRIASRSDLLSSPDVWESGSINSDRQEIKLPESVKLNSGSRYYWQVRIWDQQGQESRWSEITYFTTGLLEEDWTAEWMAPPVLTISAAADKEKNKNEERPTWWMRRIVKLDNVPDRVALAVVCLGYYELYVNGKRVGNEPLAPSVTKLDKRGLCVTHEIGELLQPGENIIALASSSGWYLPNRFKVYEGKTPLIRMQAYTRDGDKLQTIFGSDLDWFAREANRTIIGRWGWNNFGGEAVDGRLESSSWKEIGHSTEGWNPVNIVSTPPIVVSARTCPPNRIGATYKAEKVRLLSEDLYEIDFGRCLAGIVRLRFPNVSRDKKIVMRFFDLPADYVSKKDQSYKQISTYVTRGDGTDVFENKFNYAGFRYVTIEGLDEQPELENFEAMLVETALDPVGTFNCSNELFNQIHELNVHTIRCLNLGGYHVDCPQRERNGYGADGQTAMPAYPYLFDSESFLHKWLLDWLDVFEPETGRIPHTAPVQHRFESPAWGGIVGPLAWQQYIFYGDRRALELAFPAVGANLERLQSWVRDGVLLKELAAPKFHGDWVAPRRGMGSKNGPTWEMKELFNTAYLIYLWQTYADMGRVLGEAEEVAKAEATIASMQESFHGNFFNEESGYYLIPEQAYQAMPLWVGAVPKEKRKEIHARLIDLIENKSDGHLDTGLPGTTFLLDYLEESENHETIYTIMNKETYPSWGYMLAQGATTIWEQWNGYWSQIHSCFAGPASWFYTGLAGIKPDPEHPGFEEFILKPAFVEGLDFVDASYRSIRGTIGSSWRRDGESIKWTVTIPPNSTGIVYVPCSDPKAINVDGMLLSHETEAVRSVRGEVIQRFRLPSGTWELDWQK